MAGLGGLALGPVIGLFTEEHSSNSNPGARTEQLPLAAEVQPPITLGHQWPRSSWGGHSNPLSSKDSGRMGLGTLVLSTVFVFLRQEFGRAQLRVSEAALTLWQAVPPNG